MQEYRNTRIHSKRKGDMMREKWKKYVEKFKSLGDKVSGVKGITAVIPAVCLAVLMVTVLTGYKTPQAKKYEASETEDISQIKEALAKESTAAMAETTKKNTTKKGKKGAIDVKDGTYKGSANGYGGKVTVNVTVSKKTMTAIDIVSAPGETDSFFQRAKGVIDEMLTAQSTDVDVVSGATYSSNGIIGAVKNALFGTESNNATAANAGNAAGSAPSVSKVSESGKWKDGTYTGSGKGFGGTISVKVTVKDGKISAIDVTSASGETASYFSKAKGIIPKMISGQTTNVDAASGATYSSNGIITAVRNALSKAETGKSSTKKKKKKVSPYMVFSTIVIILLAIAFAFPLYWILTGSFKTQISINSTTPEWWPSEWVMTNYDKLFSRQKSPLWEFAVPFSSHFSADGKDIIWWAGPQVPAAVRWLINTVFMAVASMILTCITSAMAGYALAKKRFVGRSILFTLIVCAMALPKQVILIPLLREMSSLQLYNTIWAVIFPIVGWPFGVFLMKQFSEGIPGEMLEAARIDGASEAKTFVRIALPMIKPGIGALAIFTFINSWNDYFMQLIMLSSTSKLTISLGIAKLQAENSTDYGLIMAGAALAAVPIIIVFLAFQKYFTKGITMGAVKG